MTFKNAIILGNGISANMVATELSCLDLNVEIFTDSESTFADSFSHVFYNTMLNDLGILKQKTTPLTQTLLKRKILSKYTKACFTISELRESLHDKLRSTQILTNKGYYLSDILVKDRVIKQLSFLNNGALSLNSDTLIVDCMGRMSPFHRKFDVLKSRSDICYLVARQKPHRSFKSIANPYDTFRKHDDFSTMVYTSLGGEDFLTLFTSANQKELIKLYKDREVFHRLYQRVYGVNRIQSQISAPKLYMRPELYNVYSLPSKKLPTNYIAIGDAGCATLPIFGSGALMAWKSTCHLKDALASGLSVENIDTLWDRVNVSLSLCYSDSINYSYEASVKNPSLIGRLLRAAIPSQIKHLRSIKRGSYE